jgi:predicted Fe-Mo cluster-binding NifX family protein
VAATDAAEPPTKRKRLDSNGRENIMKIAAITDDGKTISRHFGRARHYQVHHIENGTVVGRELRDKAGHHDFAHEHEHDHDHRHEGRHDPRGHGFGAGATSRHTRMIEAITDCDALLVRGMGQGAYAALEAAGIKPIVTDIETIEEAVRAYLDGKIVDHTEWLH